jgi:Leucine-rich repeat (LRR) protein
MNQAQALSLLWERVRLKVGSRHSHNLACGADAAQCLSCGGKALIYETLLSHNRFCDEECQKGLRGLDSFLSLGMKRGAAAIEEVQPDFETVELPDDVLGFLFAHAYGFALMSVEEYEELLSFRSISKQFRDVIENTTVPAIRFLCGEILARIDVQNLLQFTGLETLAHRTLITTREVVYAQEMPLEVLIVFRHLRVLILRVVELPVDNISLAHMRNLEELHLTMVEIHDSQVAELVSLETLYVERCDALTGACLAPLRRLQSLTLAYQDEFTNLNSCVQLSSLRLNQSVRIEDDGIVALVNLTHLSLPGGGEGHRRAITVLCLRNMPLLTSLDLANNPTILDLEDLEGEPVVEELRRNLRTLVISKDCRFTMAEASLFSGLTSLDLSGRRDLDLTVDSFLVFPDLRALYIEFLYTRLSAPWNMPVSLETLSIGNDYHHRSAHYLRSLVNLRCLHLFGGHVGDSDLRELPQLEVLTLTGWSNVCGEGVASLVNLRELTCLDMCLLQFSAISRLPRLAYLYCPDSPLIKRAELGELKRRGVIVFDVRSVVGLDKKPPRGRFY